MKASRNSGFLFLVIMVLSAGLISSGCEKKGGMKGMRDNPYKITSDDLLCVKALDDKHIWLTGAHGNVFHTADGGKSWKKQKTKIGEQLCEADFVDALNGWVVGSNGTIIHTADGGKNWEKQLSGVKTLLLNVDFIDAKHGWAVGSAGTLLRTKDGGKMWENLSIEYGPVLNGVSFVDALTGWIVGDYGMILHTQDGGDTWQEQHCQDIVPYVPPDEWEMPLPMLFDVCFVDKNSGWISGIEGNVLYTSDGGKNWKKLQIALDVRIYSIEVKGSMGVAVGDKGACLYSNDGGLTWNISNEMKTRKWLRHQSLAGSGICWVVGEKGTVLRTVDAGKSWEMVSGKAFDLPVSKKKPVEGTVKSN